jgi:hypothetical protein
MPNRFLPVINKYIASFERRRQSNVNDDFAPNAIAILNALKLELQGGQSDLHEEIYTHLGFHFFLDQIGNDLIPLFNANPLAFDVINVEDNTLASYLLMKQFINEMQKSSIQTEQMTALLGRYNNEALTPALEQFKQSKLPELCLSLYQKATLQGMLEGLVVCLEHSLGNRITEVVRCGKKVMQDTEMGFIRHGLSLPTLIQGIQSSVNLVNGNKDLIKIGAFLVQFQYLLLQDQISTRDFVRLNGQAQETRALLMQMPEIKEVKEYHWIINMICNYINTHIVEVFESQNTNDLNRFFGLWDSVQSRGRDQMEHDEDNLLQLCPGAII